MKDNHTLRIIAICVAISIAIIGAVYGYGRYAVRVDILEKTSIKTEENENAIIAIQKDIEYIKKCVDRIEEKL